MEHVDLELLQKKVIYRSKVMPEYPKGHSFSWRSEIAQGLLGQVCPLSGFPLALGRRECDFSLPR